ncbi:MAG: glycosyltransferase [Bacillota bacterium]|nr:glycosyltransferase [Bacillota bacterium]
MRIVIVIDQYSHDAASPEKTNGAAIWAFRFVEGLRKRGHEVRIVATGDPAPDKYVIKTKIYPLIDPIIKGNGMVLGRSDDDVVRKAYEGADVVHFMLPFKLSVRAREIAEEMGIPCFSAFHCQPENVTYNLGLKHFPPAATYIYGRYRRKFYRHVGHIHCPTEFIAGQLKKHKYRSKLHVFSNGVDEDFRPMKVERPEAWKDKIIIGMVARLAAEKRQDLIIKAVAMSKYRDKIQLAFAGKGPKHKKYEKLAQKLGINPPSFRYYSKNELIKLINMFDLYVHASEIEIEAVSCWEALACGIVPVIADAELSATRFFALDERSLFKSKDARDLCKKIEYWIEHPEEKAVMREKYIEAAQKNGLSQSLDKIEKAYAEIISENRRKLEA